MCMYRLLGTIVEGFNFVLLTPHGDGTQTVTALVDNPLKYILKKTSVFLLILMRLDKKKNYK